MDEFPSLPEDVIETARQIVESGEGMQWELGDFLVDIVDELAEPYANTQPGVVTERVIRDARAWIIRSVADRVGIDRSTARDREVMARFYPRPVRKLYYPLTYHQLRACKSAGEHWREHAEWALMNLPAPVALLRARIKDNGHNEPHWMGALRRAVAGASAVIRASQEEDVPPAVAAACEQLLAAARKVEGQDLSDPTSWSFSGF